ncbi:MAG: hypothetical protein ACI841_001441 [Planctomycetota bacterium]
MAHERVRAGQRQLCVALLCVLACTQVFGAFPTTRVTLLWPQDASFADVQARLSESDYLGALQQASKIEDALLSAQSRLHVLHHGGDLPAAFRCGATALKQFPGDLYLLDQTAFIAGTLGDSRELALLLDQVRSLRGQAEVNADELERVLSSHSAVDETLHGKVLASEQSSRRARILVLSLGGLALVALGILARGR